MSSFKITGRGRCGQQRGRGRLRRRLLCESHPNKPQQAMLILHIASVYSVKQQIRARDVACIDQVLESSSEQVPGMQKHGEPNPIRFRA